MMKSVFTFSAHMPTRQILEVGPYALRSLQNILPLQADETVAIARQKGFSRRIGSSMKADPQPKPRKEPAMSDAIFQRTSIRKYTDESLNREQVETLMRAAMAAPSAGNQQPWEFFIVTDDATKERLSACSPFAKCAAEAPVVVVVCERTEDLRFEPCAVQDLSACVENILLEATALGLGAVWLGIAPEEDRVAAVSEVLGAPCAGLKPFALVAVGHPAEEFEPRSVKRFDESRIHWM